MTKDVIALTPTMPDLPTFLAGLYAGGPDTHVRSTADGAVIQLCTPDGRPAVSIEAPVLVHSPTEVRRLLGPGLELPSDSPLWWTEARADQAVDNAPELAASFAGRLATVLKGTVWPSNGITTDVVRLNTPVAGEVTPPTWDATDAGSPGIDVLTDRAGIVVHDRPVVALTTWLSDALRTTAQQGLALQIVTAPDARLTFPMRTALAGHPNRWVVQHGDGDYYDGLSGAHLHWTDGHFSPRPDQDGTRPHPAFRQTPPDEVRQLLLSIRTVHPATRELTLGTALEAAWTELTGHKPTGWSTSEPVNLPWSPRQLTDLARHRAPRPTQVIVTGPSGIATTRITRTSNGVEENTTLALDLPYHDASAPAPAPAPEKIESLANTLVTQHNLHTMTALIRGASSDGCIHPGLEQPPRPVAVTLGTQATSAAKKPRSVLPTGAPVSVVGSALAPGRHYVLDASTLEASWAYLRALTSGL